MFKYLKHTSIFHTCYASGRDREAKLLQPQPPSKEPSCPGSALASLGPAPPSPRTTDSPTFSVGLCVVLGVIVGGSRPAFFTFRLMGSPRALVGAQVPEPHLVLTLR